jgi:mono/diheme cytochrome c family protein
MRRKIGSASSAQTTLGGAVMFAVCVVILPAPPPAHADDFAFGRRLFLDKSQCLYCHGWAGDGAGEPQSNGAAANLRVTALKRDQLIEVVKCGVPGKAMPHFDEETYTDKRCYGVTEAELGRDTPALPRARP